MKHVKETAVFTFDQLSKDAQNKAFNAWSNAEHESMSSDMLLDDNRELLQMVGFYDVSIYYALSYSQGDGAGFNARYRYKKGSVKALKEYAPTSPFVDIAKELQELQKRYFYKVRLETNTQRGSYTKIKHIEHHDGLYVEESEFLSIIRDIDKIIYDTARSELEYYTSEPCFKEWLESEDIVFDESGDQWFFASECTA